MAESETSAQTSAPVPAEAGSLAQSSGLALRPDIPPPPPLSTKSVRPPKSTAGTAAPASQDLADKTALLLIDIGEPEDAGETKAFVKRVFADHRVFDSPLGGFGRGLFRRLLRPGAERRLNKALAINSGVGGSAKARLESIAASLCRSLNTENGLPRFEPFTAFLFGSPDGDIPAALEKIRGQGFTQIAAVWCRPFTSFLARSAQEILLADAGAHPDTPPAVFIDNWLKPESAAEALGTVIQETLTKLPDAQRPKALILLALRALPVDAKRDPAGDDARALAAEALRRAGLFNPCKVVYLDTLEPLAPLWPNYEELLDRLGKNKVPLVNIPLTGLLDDLTYRSEFVASAQAEAAKRGFQHFVCAPLPFGRHDFVGILKDAVLEQLRRSVEFSEASVFSGIPNTSSAEISGSASGA